MKLSFLPDIPLPSPMAIKDTIGRRILQRTERPIDRDSDTPVQEWEEPDYLPATHDNATLVGSLLPSGNHMPVIDIDLPCMLVPSTYPGHFHLYINKEMTRKQFFKIMKAMAEAGVVQENYYRYSKLRGQARVRYPGVTKDNEAQRIREARDA